MVDLALLDRYFVNNKYTEEEKKMIFLLLFLVLTVVYTIVFTALVAGIKWLRPRLTGEPVISFTDARQQAFAKLWTSKRQFIYMAAMAMLTLIFAFTNIGDPVLISTLKLLPSQMMSDSTRQTLSDYVLQAWDNKAPLTKVEPSTFLTMEDVWSWWWADALYILFTLALFFCAAWRHIAHGFKKGYECLKKEWSDFEKRNTEKQAAAQAAKIAELKAVAGNQKKSKQAGFDNNPAPAQDPTIHSATATATIAHPSGTGDWKEFLTAGLVVSILGTIIHEAIDHYTTERELRRGGIQHEG